MWTEAHRACHEAGLKETVSTYAAEETARWLERADPPRRERATPVLPVTSATAWHLRVGVMLTHSYGVLVGFGGWGLATALSIAAS